MSPESPSHESPPKKGTSPKQIIANQNNSKKSTGPTSPDGKAKTRGNSLKHGHCALVVPVPGEDPDLFLDRFDAWSQDLNPQRHAYADYLVTVAVRHSLDLDRLNVAKTARLAQRARDARKDRTETRAREVEELLKQITDDCGTAVRRLKQSPEGCQALIDEWEHLEAALIDPAHWDKQDAHRAVCLQGHGRLARAEAPSLLEVPTKWIADHRQVAKKLSDNRWPQAIGFGDRYTNDAQHDRDKALIDYLATASQTGTGWIMTIIEAEQKHLRARMAELLEDEALEESEAALRARLDTSDEGRLLHRYAMESGRGLFKVIDLLHGGVKAWEKAMQERSEKRVKSEERSEQAAAATPAAAPQDSRNEAISGEVQTTEAGDKVVEIGGVMYKLTPLAGPTDRPDLC